MTPEHGDRRVRPLWILFAIVGVTVALVVVAGAALTRTPLFRVREVHVVGASRLPRDAIVRIAGVAEGANIFSFDAAAAEARLEGDPWIVEAAVGKDLPSTVEIRVREQGPVATVRMQGVRRLVGADGELLDARPGRGLPEILVEDATARDREVIGAAARALAAMPATLRGEVGAVAVLVGTELRVDLRSGIAVTYGPARAVVAKAQAIRALLRWAAARGVGLEAMDVRIPTAPTARLAGGSVVVP